jgi:hypothetical protein
MTKNKPPKTKATELAYMVLIVFTISVFISCFFFGDNNERENLITGASIGIQDINIQAAATPTSCGTVSADLTLSANISSSGTCFIVAAHNIVIDGNNSNITGDGTGCGINNSDGYDNITIKNFIEINDFACGIRTEDAFNVTIFNNTIDCEDPIFIKNGRDNNISFNTVSATTAVNSRGIEVWSQTNTYVMSNDIVVNQKWSYGIKLFSSSNSFVESNTITMSGSGERGITLHTNSNYNIIQNNTIIGSTATLAPAIWVATSHNQFFSNTVSCTGCGSGIELASTGTNNTFINDTLSGTITNDVNIEDGHGTFTNVSFDKTSITFSAGRTGTLTVKWYVDFNVTNSTNQTLQNAEVKITNVSGDQLSNELTTADGRISRQVLTESVLANSGTTYHTPHTIETNLAGYDTNTTNINLTTIESALFRIIMAVDNVSPIINLVSPANETAINQSSQTFTCNVTDSGLIYNLTLYIWNSTGSLNHTNTTSLNGTTNETDWTYTLPYEGNFSWNCLGYDSAGNNNWSEEGNQTIILDTTIPQAILNKNVSQVEYGYGAININWSTTDNFNIDSVLFNITYPNGSLLYNSTINSGDINLSSAANLSVLGVYTINLRVNDTAGNINLTSDTFSVNDTTNPNVTLVSPAASYANTNVANSLSINFTCNVTDNYLLKNISLYLTDSNNVNFAQNRTATINGTTNSSNWTVQLGTGTYTWNCLAYDNNNNLDWGDNNRTITLSYSATDTPLPPSDGGGGGGGKTILANETKEIKEVRCSLDSDCEFNQYCFENECYAAECTDDSICKEDEVCHNLRCVKLFDVEIKEFESPVKLGDFFDFTYLIKGMADFNDDVTISFSIKSEETIVTSGQDVIYLGSFEEKTKTTKLFLPSTVASGVYTFSVVVTYGNYKAESFRTIEIIVGEEGTAEITMLPEKRSLVGSAMGWGKTHFNLGLYIFLGIIFLLMMGFIGLIILKRKMYNWKKEWDTPLVTKKKLKANLKK